MLRKVLAAALALMICVGGLLAAEVKGKVKSVDAEKKTITITIKGEEKTYKVAADCKFTTKNKKVAEKLSAEGLKFEGFAKNPAVTLTVEGDEVKQVTVGGGGKPKDK